jgi:hypothetical protein
MDLGGAIFVLTALLTSTALLTGAALSLSFLDWKAQGAKLGQGDETMYLKKAKPPSKNASRG